MLAHGGAGGGLGLTFPDSEQRPKRGYPLGAHPLFNLARLTGTAPPLGLTYPDGEQRPKRSYLLGAHPLFHLARTNGIIPPIPPTPSPVQPILRGGGGGYPEIDWGPKRHVESDEELMEILLIILPHLL